LQKILKIFFMVPDQLVFIDFDARLRRFGDIPYAF